MSAGHGERRIQIYRTIMDWRLGDSKLQFPDSSKISSYSTKYDEVIKGQLKIGITEFAKDKTADDTRKRYIPHHAVINSSSASTKVKTVYDASSKSKKSCLSLNEYLYRGPFNLENLRGLLMRFWIKRIALIADIEKAFLQVGLNEVDRDVTRFLWVKDIKKTPVDINLQVYIFTRITSGVISSSYLLGSTVKHHLENIGTPVAVEAVYDIFIDNLISGVSTTDEAIQFYK